MHRDRVILVQGMLQLGDLRAEEAAPALAQFLDFHVSHTGQVRTGEIPPPEAVYPAVNALIRIGEPAVPASVRRWSAASEPSSSRPNAAYVVMQITGGNEPARQVLLKLAEGLEGERRTRLTDLAETIPVVE